MHDTLYMCLYISIRITTLHVIYEMSYLRVMLMCTKTVSANILQMKKKKKTKDQSVLPDYTWVKIEVKIQQ